MRNPVSKKAITIIILLIALLLIIAPANTGSASISIVYIGSSLEPVKKYLQDTDLTETPTPIPLDYSRQELEEEQPFGIIIGAGLLVVMILAGTLFTLSRIRSGSKKKS